MLKIISQNMITGKAWDISELVSDVTWTTSMNFQAGKLTFKFIQDHDVNIEEGSPLTFAYNNINVFYGYIFKREIDENEIVSVTAYDQMRYLKNKDTYVIQNMTASQIFEKMCKDMQLSYKVVSPSWYVVPQKIMDNKTLFDIIEHGVDNSLVNEGNWYTVYDNYGVVTFNNIPNMATDVFIGDASGLSGFKFSSSIDDDTYNQIKIVKENKETKKRELYIVKDSSTIKRWGLLQYFEKIDEKANFAQISARADMLLKIKNRKTRKLKLNSIDGSLKLRAGSGVVVGIALLAQEGLDKSQYFMIETCTHKFTSGDHTMDLEMRLSI